MSGWVTTAAQLHFSLIKAGNLQSSCRQSRVLYQWRTESSFEPVPQTRFDKRSLKNCHTTPGEWECQGSEPQLCWIFMLSQWLGVTCVCGFLHCVSQSSSTNQQLQAESCAPRSWRHPACDLPQLLQKTLKHKDFSKSPRARSRRTLMVKTQWPWLRVDNPPPCISTRPACTRHRNLVRGRSDSL